MRYYASTISILPILFVCFLSALSFYILGPHIQRNSLEDFKQALSFNLTPNINETTPMKSKAIQGEFISVDYYLSKELRPTLYLNASKLIIEENTEVNNSSNISMNSPQGFTYRNDTKIHYKAMSGKWLGNHKTILLETDIKIWDDSSYMKGQIAKYVIEENYFHIQKNVKAYMYLQKNQEEIYINADDAQNWNTPTDQRSLFTGSVRGKILRKNPLEQGVFFRSHIAFADTLKSLIELKEEVRIKKGDLIAKGEVCEIFLENYNKKVRYYVLKNDVKILEKVFSKTKKGEVFERRAFGEKLEGFINEKKMILTGYPKVIQGKDIIKGNIITMFENNEVVEVDDSNTSFEIK